MRKRSQSPPKPHSHAARILAFGDAERRRVARELHDDISQRLALLADDADRLRSEAKFADEPGRRRLDDLVERARNLAEDLRRLSHRLHPAIVQDLGLAAALRSLTSEFEERTGMRASFVEKNAPRQLPPDVGTALYRIAQEALRNVTKHAGQTSVLVTLDARPAELVLFVSDFGAGFDPAHAPGLGLISMRERAYLAGGAFSIVSSRGNGATIQVRIPIAAEPTQ
jgi:two-component system CheB/CheR fusion protein